MSNKPDEQPVSESQASPLRRLSRRSALKKAAGIAGASLAAGAGGMVPINILSSKQDDSQLHTVVYQAILTDKDVLRQRVMASAAMQPLLQRYGTNALTTTPVLHVKFHATDLEAVSMVLERSGQPSRSVWAYFNPKHPDFKVLQFEFVPTSEMHQALQAGEMPTVSGHATFFTASDRTLSRAIFNSDVVVAIGTPPIGLDVEAGEDWSCFSDCLAKLWNTLPGWLQAICAGSCTGCLAHLLPACVPCAGCLAGYVGGCLSVCWS